MGKEEKQTNQKMKIVREISKNVYMNKIGTEEDKLNE